MIELNLALIDCVKRGDAEAAESLLCAGADPNTLDLVEELPAVVHATRQGDGRLAGVLLRYGAQRPVSAPVESNGESSGAAQSAPPSPPIPRTTPSQPAEGRSPSRSAEKPPQRRARWIPAVVRLYHNQGYIRRPRQDAVGTPEELERLREVRFLLSSKASLKHLEPTLREAGFDVPPPVRLGGRLVLVIPGRLAVARLISLLAQASPGE
jgi:hypothetical protein